VRCGRCGNENGEANRFCGMCGAALVAKTSAAGQAPTAAPAGNITEPRPAAGSASAGSAPSVLKHADPAPPAALGGPTGLGSTTTERRPAAVLQSNAGERTGPVITGPSFLGLNTPPAGVGRVRAGDPKGGRDPLQPSSGSLDYLLEDEEESKRGWGKVILVVAALALALGFGYLHWRQGGFDWLNAGDKKPAAAKTTPDAGQSADSGGSGTAASPDAAAPQTGASGTGAGGTAASPAESAAAQPNPSQNTSQGAASQNTASQTTASQNTPSQNPPSDPNLAAEAGSQAASADSDQPSPPVQPPARPRAETRKPEKPAAAKPVDVVTEAERYIYGRGVRQDCDHGMRLLKPAAEKSDPKAMISLGAMYSTGTCTPRDLPTAYRWFALALHKQPDNQALQDDLQKLWSRMTPPERQLAIKLSQ